MAITYTWLDEEQTGLRLEGDETEFGPVNFPVDPEDPYYVRYLESGLEPLPYVAPPEPEPPTAEEKLARIGLTVNELKQLLGL